MDTTFLLISIQLLVLFPITINSFQLETVLPKISRTGTNIEFRIGKLRWDESREAANVLASAFPSSHPHSWARALGMNKFLDVDATDESLRKSMSSKDLGCIGAYRLLDSRIIGLVVMEYVRPPKFHEPRYLSTNNNNENHHEFAFNSMRALVSECNYKFRTEFHRRNTLDSSNYDLNSEIAFISWLAVDEETRGSGVASELVEAAEGQCRRGGFDYALAYGVSPTAARVFLRQGFELWDSVNYNEFIYEGRKPFAILPDECSILIKKL